jgi:hypothetical protein
MLIVTAILLSTACAPGGMVVLASTPEPAVTILSLHAQFSKWTGVCW